MSDYDEYFDTFDEDALAEVNAMETLGDAERMSKKSSATSANSPPKSASIEATTPGLDSDSTFFDLTLDGDDMEELEEAAVRKLNSQAGPSRLNGPVRTLSTSRQTDLHGRTLPSASPPKQVQHRPIFGQKLRKTKAWDQTAFAKTGWRSTKPPKTKKGKGKAADEEDEDCVDLEGLPAPYMPSMCFYSLRWTKSKLVLLLYSS